jgi:hypothetical protein
MGNNPVGMVDPDGGYSWLVAWAMSGFNSDLLVRDSGGEWGVLRDHYESVNGEMMNVHSRDFGTEKGSGGSIGKKAFAGRINDALDIGGGAYGALRGLTASHGYWLGKNGKYYSNDWGGNRFTGSRSGAFRAANQYKWAGRTAVFVQAGLGVYSVMEGYISDGGHFGYNAQRSAASTVGSIGFGIAGAKLGSATGAAVGVWFGGIGAIPGAVIGGLGLGFGGSILGGEIGGTTVDYLHGK